ncbi:QWxxN domain [Enterococcus mundtii]|uniref:QWxxN domain n=1 Tax=Enterococcus mundtii TaxID=53346 RepID=UPI00189A068A|nr:QWxxN domain [Enterococcus mundtii]MDV7743882.1 QWxxN domain [Enterococcus mundtii]
MTKDSYSEEIGKLYNRRHEDFKQLNDQMWPNYHKNQMGNTLTSKGLRSLTGYLYICNILGNFQIVGEVPLTRQQVGKKQSAAFKEDTYLKVRQKEKKFTMDSPSSPSSSSSADLKRFSYPDVHETVNPLIEQLSSINPMIYLTAKTHQWHLNMQQLAQLFSKRANYTMNRKLSNQKQHGAQKSLNHTQNQFSKIRQAAILRAQQSNEQQSLTLSQNHFEQPTKETNSSHFIAKNSAEKLKNVFEANVNYQFRLTDIVPSGSTSEIVSINEDSLITAFWKDMTDQFTIFFSIPENATFTEQMKDLNGTSVLDLFLQMINRVFYMNDEQQMLSDDQAKNAESVSASLVDFISESFQGLFFSKNSSITHAREEGIFSQLWSLTNKLSDTLDDYIDKWDVLKVRGVEAAPWFDISPLNPRSDHRLESSLRSYETLQMATSYIVFLATKRYIQNNLPEYELGEKQLPFWYNYALFQERNETEKINTAVKKYLREEGYGWWLEDDTSMRSVFANLQQLENSEVVEKVIDRRTQIAHIIFDTCRLSTHGMTDERANAIFLQWRNNNIFKNVQFKIVKKITWTPSNVLSNEEKNKPVSETTPATISSKKTDLERIDELVTDLMNNRNPLVNDGELLPIFYYQYDLFEHRAKTSEVNQQLKKLLEKSGITPSSDSGLELVKAIEKYSQEDWGSKKSYKSRKIQYLAYVILKAYGVGQSRLGDSLSANQLFGIFMQWKTNTLLEKNEYQKMDQQTIYYKLSPWEDSLLARNQEQKSESNQIYDDFINERYDLISHEHPLIPFVYYPPLFEVRSNIVKAVNDLKKILDEKGIPTQGKYLEDVSKAVDNWIIAGETYKKIIKRVKKIAEIIVKTYKLEEKDLSIDKAFAIYLQWGNNNAYYGYTIEKDKRNYAYEWNKGNKREELEKKIITFLHENEIDSSKPTSSEPLAFSLPNFTLEQNEVICKNMTNFLSERGFANDLSNKNILVKSAASWALVEGLEIDTIDWGKLKELVRVILGDEKEKVISNEEAQQIFVKWMKDTIEMDTPSLEVKPKENTLEQKQSHSMSKAIVSKWQSENIKNQMELFFRQKGLLSERSTKEELLLAVGKWFTQEGVGTVLMPDKVQAVAKIILNELDLYGGKSDEKISNKDAEATVMKWVFETVLEKSVETYIVQSIISAPDPATFTIGRLRKLFEVHELIEAGLIKQRPEKEEQETITKLWILLTKKMLPNYFLETSQLADELLISDYDSLMQLIGSKFLEDTGYRSNFNKNETNTFGMFLFDIATHQGIDNLNELNYFFVPALLATAQLEPERLSKAMELGIHKEFALSSFMSYYQKGYFNYVENQEDVEHLYQEYEEAFINWRRKKGLVNEVLAECERLGIRVSLFGDQVYLDGGNPCPGPWIPRDLEKWYTELTKEVADKHRALNKKLMEYAFHSLNIEDFNFIISPKTHIYEAFTHLKNEVHYYAPSAPGSISPVFFGNRETWLDTTLNLEKTNILVAVNEKEERWYALKNLDKEGGYAIYRVDQDPMLYLKYGLFDKKNIWGEGYSKAGEKIRIGKKDYTFSSQVDRMNAITSKGDLRTVIDRIAQKHRDQLYRQLYDSGNDKTVASAVWDGVKHFIPFYDCIVGINNRDTKGAAISCTIDVVLLLPVLGQVTSLNLKFGLSVAKATIVGGAEGMVKNSVRALPNIAEIESLVIGVIRYIDPGVELAKGSSQLVLHKLINMKTRAFIRKDIKPLLVKLNKIKKPSEPLSKELISAQLKKNGPKVFVKRVKAQLYVRVTNLKTRDVFGEYYTLRGGQLRVFEGQASFTSEQLDLINRLSNKVDIDQQFVEEKNPNVKFYGDGMILTGKKQGEQSRRYIIIKNKITPIRETVIKDQGVRYDIYEGERVFPVNYNGIEWYFEPATSRTLSEEVLQKVSKNIDKFQSLKEPSTISPPDDLGLMISETGRTYIKINERYVPLVLFHKEKQRYHLVKNDILEPMTVLRLDLANDQFRFETELEKRSLNFQSYAQPAGGKDEVPDDQIPSTSKSADSLFDHLASSSSQVLVDNRYPPYFQLPDTLPYAKEWNKLRQAIELPDDTDIVEDPKVTVPVLSEFVPEFPPYVISDEAKLREQITSGIKGYFPKDSNPNYRVFSGIDITKAPESLKPFLKQFTPEFQNAHENFKKFIEKEKELSKEGALATTTAGAYLIEMFRLGDAENQEQILKEIMKRLLSVAKKSAQLLQQTEDFNFKNIWLVSTDLLRDEVTKNYYSQIKGNMGAHAFVMRFDPECRIIFMLDSFHVDPATRPGIQVQPSPKDTLMHEVTHIVVSSDDLISYPRSPVGFRNSGEDLRERYEKKFLKLIHGEGFNSFVENVSDMLKLPTVTKQAVLNAILTDKMLKANLQITDAEMLMACIRDIGLGRNFFERAPMKRSLADQLGNGDLLFALAVIEVVNVENLVNEHPLETTLEKAEITTEINVSQHTQAPSGNRSFSAIKNIGKTNSNDTNTRLMHEQKIRRRAELNL